MPSNPTPQGRGETPVTYTYLVDADAGNRGRLYDGTDAAAAMAAWSKAISRGVEYVTLEALRDRPPVTSAPDTPEEG